MIPSIFLRPLTLAHAPAWVRLRHALWPDAELSELEEELADLLADSRQTAFGAFSAEGQLLAFVEAALHETVEGCTTSPVGYIEGWYVLPEYRRAGFGRRLIAAAEDWARACGCREMASDTTPEYPFSPAAHYALGYVEIEDKALFFRKLL